MRRTTRGLWEGAGVSAPGSCRHDFLNSADPVTASALTGGMTRSKFRRRAGPASVSDLKEASRSLPLLARFKVGARGQVKAAGRRGASASSVLRNGFWAFPRPILIGALRPGG
jgi:hypothetical protein